MKTLTFALLILSPLFSEAKPMKGDSITHECTVTGHVPYTVKSEIFELDSSLQIASVRITYSMPNALPEEYTVPVSDLTANDAVFKNCGRTLLPGGILVEVQTPAGLFKACKLVGDDHGDVKTTYLSEVPFQLLKMESDQFSCTTLQISKH